MPFFRNFGQIFRGITVHELSKIIRQTKCKIPCYYKEYKLAYNPPRKLSDETNETYFGLMTITENTDIEEEVLLYPSSKSENFNQLSHEQFYNTTKLKQLFYHRQLLRNCMLDFKYFLTLCAHLFDCWVWRFPGTLSGIFVHVHLGCWLGRACQTSKRVHEINVW